MNPPSSPPANESPPSPGARAKRGRWIVWVAVVCGAGFIAAPHLRRFIAPEYVVTAGEAIYRPYLPWNVISPALLTLEVKCECNRRRSIGCATMTVDSLTDGLGRDLLAGPYSAVDFNGRYDGGIDLQYESSHRSGFRGGIGNWPAGLIPERFSWIINCPKPPDKNSRTLHLLGHTDVWENGDVAELVLPDVSLEVGTRFQLENAGVEIVSADYGKPGSSYEARFDLHMQGEGVFLESIEARAADGQTVKTDGIGRQRLVSADPNAEPRYVLHFSGPSGVKRAELTVSYRKHSLHRRLPVDLWFQIREVSALDDPKRVGVMAGAPSRLAPTDSDWGLPMADAEAPASAVRALKATGQPASDWPEITIPLEIEVAAGTEPAATDMRLDVLEDSKGTNLLNPAPWNSDEYRHVTFYWDFRDSYKISVWSTDALTGSGVYRLGFGSDETTVTIQGGIEPSAAPKQPGEPQRVGPVIEVGNIKLVPLRLGSDFVEFKAVGNLGIIREITALDASGTVLGKETIQRHPFHSKECGFGFNLEQPGEIRAWRITYYRKLSWVERPFEFATAGFTAADEAEDRVH